jgi:hypothetical protein
MTGNSSAVGRRREDAGSPSDRARLAWIGRRLRRVLDADRRRHVTDARFYRLLADDEPEHRPGTTTR